MDDAVRDRITHQLASPQWALMRQSDNITDERDVVVDDAPATFNERFPQRSFQLDYDPQNPAAFGAVTPATHPLEIALGGADLDRMLKR